MQNIKTSEIKQRKIQTNSDVFNLKMKVCSYVNIKIFVGIFKYDFIAVYKVVYVAPFPYDSLKLQIL